MDEHVFNFYLEKIGEKVQNLKKNQALMLTKTKKICKRNRNSRKLSLVAESMNSQSKEKDSDKSIS